MSPPSQAPYSARVLAIYTRDVSRWPRPSVQQQRDDLVELTLRRTRLWRAILSYAPLQSQVLEQVCTIARAPAPPARRRNGYRPTDLDAFSKTLAMTPNNAALVTRLVTEVVALGRGGLSPLKLSRAHREGLAEHTADLERLHASMLRQRDLVVARNLRLVFGVAKRFKSSTLHFEDMLAEGNLGLIRAVDRFDIRHDVRFSTYAVHWIRHAIGRFVDDNCRTIRVPVNARMKHRQVRKARAALEVELGDEPTSEQVGAAVGMPPQRVEQLDRDMLLPLSLDYETEWGATLGEVVEDDAPLPDEVLVQRRVHRQVHFELGQMRDMQAKVLRERFGLGDDDPRTLDAIGRDLELSRERVRQIQVIALGRLRARARAAGA